MSIRKFSDLFKKKVAMIILFTVIIILIALMLFSIIIENYSATGKLISAIGLNASMIFCIKVSEKQSK